MTATETRKRTNLDGRTWLRYSISVWDDIKKSQIERSLGHPAMYPAELVTRLLKCYFWDDHGIVLDPFLGSGSTLVAAALEGLDGIGFEIVPDIVNLAYRRLKDIQLPLLPPRVAKPLIVEVIDKPTRLSFPSETQTIRIVRDDARKLMSYLDPSTIDIAITSPPYWNIHSRNRSVDRKQPRPYSDLPDDLGNIEDYFTFLCELEKVFGAIYRVLKPGAYCIVNVMDLRRGDEFIVYHADIIKILRSSGFFIRDIIIWNRASEYNNLRPMGYPYKFIVNKVHEYILVFQKPW
jgi:DNA modification methylase